MTYRALLLLAVVLTAGCGGLVAPEQGTPTPEDQRLRYVVGNDADTAQTVTLTFTDDAGDTVLNETETLEPGGGWVVATFDVDELRTPVTIVARLPDQGYRNELSPIRSTDRGAVLKTVTEDGFNHYHCDGSVDCWQDAP